MQDSTAPASQTRRATVPDDGPSEARETPATVLAVLPWLGVPVLVSALLARLGRPLPGEVLPVAAFVPLAIAAYLVALRVEARRRAWAVGIPGAVVLVALLAFVGQGASPGAARTFLVAVAATMACVAIAVAVGRTRAKWGGLATGVGVALVFAQGLDGWLTYLAVGNPFGWLGSPVEERVLVSRLILEVSPVLYPILKLGLAVVLALALQRSTARGPWSAPLVLVVCYVGLSPATFSAANLLR